MTVNDSRSAVSTSEHVCRKSSLVVCSPFPPAFGFCPADRLLNLMVDLVLFVITISSGLNMCSFLSCMQSVRNILSTHTNDYICHVDLHSLVN